MAQTFAKKYSKDMTTGDTFSLLISFMIPMMIGNIFQQFYNIVDTIIAGKFIDANALAAVGTCGSMNFFCFSLSGGLSIGIGIVVSQYFGARNDKMVRLTISNAIFVLTAASLLVTLLGFFACPYVLRLLHCPDAILPDAVLYMRTTVCGLIFVAFYNGVASILRALGDSMNYRNPLTGSVRRF